MVYRRRNKRSTNLSTKVRAVMKRVAYSTQETKHHRIEESVNFSTNGSLIELNTVDSQGDASGQFVGAEIRQIGLRIRGKLSQADANNTCRVVLFTPSANFETLLQTGVATPTDLFYLPSNWSAIRPSQVNKVYYDRNVVLNIASGQNDKIKLVNIWVNLNMRKYRINESTAPLTGSDKVYMLLLSDSLLPNHPAFDYSSMLYYKDA